MENIDIIDIVGTKKVIEVELEQMLKNIADRKKQIVDEFNLKYKDVIVKYMHRFYTNLELKFSYMSNMDMK